LPRLGQDDADIVTKIKRNVRILIFNQDPVTPTLVLYTDPKLVSSRSPTWIFCNLDYRRCVEVSWVSRTNTWTPDRAAMFLAASIPNLTPNSVPFFTTYGNIAH